MIRQITTRLIQGFAVHNKTQNFFDMNPVFPDFGEKNFDIYNSERKKINVLDQYKREEGRKISMQRLVQEKLFTPKYEKYRRYMRNRSLRVDESTHLSIGIDSQYDDFVAIYKREMFMDTTAKSQFKQTLLKLIYRFKCKSEAELIKLFRISIANSRKKDFVEKIRAQIMQDAILQSSYLNQQKLKNIQKDQVVQEEGFKMALKQIDEKIAKAEQALRFDKRGFPKILSMYDSKYGWLEPRKETVLNFEDQELQTNDQITIRQENASFPQDGKIQDWSIKSRISRLYYLRRLEYLKRQSPKIDDIDVAFKQELPNHIRNKQKIMNQIAHMYKADELIQVPDLQEIYRDIDSMIDKVYVKVHSGKTSTSKNQSKDQIFDRSPESKQFLWENICAEEILCDTMYSQDATKDIVLENHDLDTISPSHHTELSLSKIPINLYRHTQLENFGIYNEHKQKLATNLLRVQQIDFEPHFQDFSLETARKKYRRFKQKIHVVSKVSKGHARRKTSYAEAYVKKGTGVVTINGKPVQDYFGDTFHRAQALKPLVFTDSSGLYDVRILTFGGGQRGQAECMSYALARALIKIDPQHKRVLAGFGLVGFDFRKKEPKKTNLYSARVRPPYVRR